ncbi:MAG TPA: DUF1653 domain-containing protein [Candidatus Paceibacterota bacterium]|nr:DUF1653 domain-containing protein [Candidatus Paceibacterota bacterium]
MKNEIKLGKYRHFKGKDYRMLGVAKSINGKNAE